MKNFEAKKTLLLASAILSGIALSSCEMEADPNTVFVSSAPIYALAKEIIKDIKPLEVITPAGIEPHDYEISARKVAGIYDGLCLFVNGLGMECWADRLPSLAKEKTYCLSDGVPTLQIDGSVDPHIWLNPQYAVKEMETIKNVMVTIDPDNSVEYIANFQAAKAKFLDVDALSELALRQMKNKYLCVSHAAFGYLCDRYGLIQISVNGLEPDREPSTRTLQEIIGKVNDYGITTVFAEEVGNIRIAEKIAEETGCKLETLSTMEDIGKTEDYLTIFRENIEKIEEAGK